MEAVAATFKLVVLGEGKYLNKKCHHILARLPHFKSIFLIELTLFLI